MGFNSWFKGLNSAQDGVGVQRHEPATSPPAKRPDTFSARHWVGPTVEMNECDKITSP